MTNQIEQAPYLREQREFPSDDLKKLARQTDQAYIDIATKVNLRTIGVFSSNQSITGESWYLKGSSKKQQVLRRVFPFNSTEDIETSLTMDVQFTRMYGTFTDGEIWYPLPYVDVVDATNQISFSVSDSDIVFAIGGGSPPTVDRGFIILEWISQS